MSLVEAIDSAVAYVRAHPNEMTRAEVEDFRTLAEDVYMLAFRVGLADALPKVPELLPELESTDLPLSPVQFISKLNLPGDWDTSVAEHVFLVCAPPRWFHDIEILRKLVEAKSMLEAEIAPQPRVEEQMERIALAVGDENAAKIMAIAHQKDLSGNEKMQEILQIDLRFEGKDSTEWGALLGVSPAAVRQYKTWKAIQQGMRSNG